MHSTNNFKYLLLAIIFCALFACSDDATQSSTSTANDRPYSPWVFRSVLDQKPRIITLALHPNLYAAYYTESGSLFKTWNGEVLFDGPVYTNNHGPQPISIGNSYIENDMIMPWKVKINDNPIDVSYQFLGYKTGNNKAVLRYQLSSSSLNTPIVIEEAVDASKNDLGNMIFERSFEVNNTDEAVQVILQSKAQSIVTKENISTNATIENEKIEEVKKGSRTLINYAADLVLLSHNTTHLDVTYSAGATIISPHAMGDEEDEVGTPEGARLIARNDCKTCHNKNVKTIGPAYRSVAEKYANTEDNISLLINKVKTGGSGIWGNQIMNAHPDLSTADIREMVTYIMSLDADTEKTSTSESGDESVINSQSATTDINMETIIPGALTQVYNISKSVSKMSDIKSTEPIMAGIMANFDNINGGDFAELDENFAIVVKGYLKIDKSDSYSFRVWSDDGTLLTINDQQVIDNDGPHGTEYGEATLSLEKGLHPFKLEYFQGAGGKFLSLNWKPNGADAWKVIPPSALFHTKDMQSVIGDLTLPMANFNQMPGDGSVLNAVHPSFDLSQMRPDEFAPRVGGMDFMSDGRMVVSTWDAAGSVYMLDNLKAENHNDINVTKIAEGLAEPLGLKIVDDEIYVMQKQELTKLVDNNKDGLIDEYQTICDKWKVSANFHEFGFGLAYKDGYFYATLATAIDPGGASTQPQIADRGKCIKIGKDDGSLEFVASGLRTPNGVGIGYGNDIYVADNQGDWLPASKIVRVKKGAFYGSRSVDPEGTKDLKETPPVVWLPQDEIGNSPSTPLSINVGPYKNQMIHGEVTNGGIKRVFVEEVNGQLQGSLFRFIQGLEAGVNRITWGPDGALYAGGIGSTGNWGQTGKLWYGLQRLAYNEVSTFEMLAVRAKSNGMEIEFTEPLMTGDGWNTEDYLVKQWYYEPTKEYGGPKMNEQELKVNSATVSEDRKRVFLQIDGLKDGHVLYIKLLNHYISSLSHSLWSTETWYTMNQVPDKNVKGVVQKSPFNYANNVLTAEEEADNWQLLFDGKSTKGWHNYGKKTIGSSWKVQDEALTLATDKKSDEGWQVADGGDILTDKQYTDFELRLEWKIANCGNSGIMFAGQESDKYQYIWQTGPEMQILDNTCHPDTRFVTHRAGDLYDMIETKFMTVKPAGNWNKVRIRKKEGAVEFWLNGYKVVDFTMYDDNWKEMVSKSKFADWEGFGTSQSGHIALQDHGDRVWFRNIKIKEL